MSQRGWMTIVWVVMVSLPLVAGTASADEGDDDLIRVGEYTISASHPPMPEHVVYGDETFTGVLTGSDGNGNSYTWTYFGVFHSETLDPDTIRDCVDAIAQKILDNAPPDDWGEALSSCVE